MNTFDYYKIKVRVRIRVRVKVMVSGEKACISKSQYGCG